MRRALGDWLSRCGRLSKPESEADGVRLETLFRQARFDPLTHLPNRSYLLETLEAAVQRDAPLAVVFVDLDGFKAINDTWGHKTGDDLLKLVAARLKANVRHSDFVARLGGDEFVLILRDIVRQEDISGVCRRLLQELAQPFWVEQQVVHVGASMGIACWPAHEAVGAAALLEQADQALYEAKRRGRNQWRFYDRTFAQRLYVRQRKRKAFEADWRRKRFEARFYPLTQGAASERVVGAQMTAWWMQGPDGERAYEQWQALLQGTGQRLRIGQWMVDSAAWQLAQWQHLPPGFRLWAPLDAALIVHHGEKLADFLASRLAQRWVTPERIGWSVSLSLLQQLTDAQLRVFSALAQAGFSLVVHGVGRYPVDLIRLSRLPANALTVDARWVADSLAQSRKGENDWFAALARGVSALSLDLCVEKPSSRPLRKALAERLDDHPRLLCVDRHDEPSTGEAFYRQRVMPALVASMAGDDKRRRQA